MTSLRVLTALLLLPVSRLPAEMMASLHASAANLAPLGTPVTWTTAASGGGDGPLLYRYRIQAPGGDFRTVVDYGPKASLTWTTIDQEGNYQIEAAVMNTATGEVSVTAGTMSYTPLVRGADPVLTATANPLVFIYSAPPCPLGDRMRVQFQTQNGQVQFTPYKACQPGVNMNFYLAGMQPGPAYQIQHTIDAGHILAAGPVMSFSSSATVTDPLTFTPIANAFSSQGLLLQSLLGSPAVATDLQGNLVWLGPPDVTYLTRPVTGGTFLGVGENPTQDVTQQFIREFDLAGITVAETNAARINQQLATMGVHAISGFHHEMRKLPGGGYLALASSERILTDVQGPGPVDVIGDTILVLSQDLQVTWAWDAFDHLDPHRIAILGEQCNYPAGLACAPFYLSTTANDWLHGNALQLTPDGNILYSARHQDWLIKIDYANGNGAGDILWRMGTGGDFQNLSSDPNPWFSHQHDPHFEQNNTVLLLFDNGNTRAAADPNAHSRGQALEVDERNRVVRPRLNADLGLYSAALGTAQQLPDGNYHFDAGFLLAADSNGNPLYAARSLEVDASGNIDLSVQFNALEYRSFRMPDLYTAPEDQLRVFINHPSPPKGSPPTSSTE
jgi:arylsulfate sulfotransferase